MTTISTIENDPARGEPTLAGAALSPTEPDRNCPLCPRLAGFREAARVRNRNVQFTGAVVRRSDGSADDRRARARPARRQSYRPASPAITPVTCSTRRLLEYGFAKGNYQARPTTADAGGVPDQQTRYARAAQNQAAAAEISAAGNFSSRRSKIRACARSWRSAGLRMNRR